MEKKYFADIKPVDTGNAQMHGYIASKRTSCFESDAYSKTKM